MRNRKNITPSPSTPRLSRLRNRQESKTTPKFQPMASAIPLVPPNHLLTGACSSYNKYLLVSLIMLLSVNVLSRKEIRNSLTFAHIQTRQGLMSMIPNFNLFLCMTYRNQSNLCIGLLVEDQDLFIM